MTTPDSGSPPRNARRRLHDLVDDALRVVVRYDEDGFDFLYCRDDVEDRYTEAEIDHVHDEAILADLGTEYLEAIFNTGELRCSMHGFEEAFAFRFPDGEHAGLAVSVNADAEVALDLGEFVDRCEEGSSPTPREEVPRI